MGWLHLLESPSWPAVLLALKLLQPAVAVVTWRERVGRRGLGAGGRLGFSHLQPNLQQCALPS
jgi:hypothetical protein